MTMTSVFTRQQREAILKLYQRLTPDSSSGALRWDSDGKRWISYRQFRRQFHYSSLMGCVMGPWCGMIVGIESDGHTHS